MIFEMRTKSYPYALNTIFSSVPENTATELEPGIGMKSDGLRYVDYRHTRFALNPMTGLFSLVRSVFPYYLSNFLSLT
jgi:hypothetical protein